MGLTSHADKMTRVLSGGQQKRVNVAMELTARPRLLLLDEPTSGLDPAGEIALMGRLKGLSNRGMTVLCVSHSLNLHYFDRVVVLRPWTEGKSSVLYSGPPNALLQIPEIGGSFQRLFGVIAAGNEDFFTQTGELPDSATSTRKRGRVLDLSVKRLGSSRDRFLSQSVTVFTRSVLSVLRDRSNLRLSFVIPVLFAAAIVLSQKEQGYVGFICSFTAIAAFWLGMSGAVRELVKERMLYIRDKLSGINPMAYLAGKLSLSVLFAFLQAIILFLSVAVFLTILKKLTVTGEPIHIVYKEFAILQWPLALLPVLIAAAGGALTGLLVSALAKTENAAVAAMPLIMLPQFLFSRIAFGDGATSYLDSAPFGSILHPPAIGKLWDVLLYLLSLPFVTRSATMTMTMVFKQTNHGTGETVVEWIYLLILLCLYAFGTILVFDRKERKMRDWR